MSDSKELYSTRRNQRDSSLCLETLFVKGKLDELRTLVKTAVQDRTFNCTDLIKLAKQNKEATCLAKELVQAYQINEGELTELIAKEIRTDIETFVDAHLEEYQKYTLNAPQLDSDFNCSKSKFFNLISLLKDVSALGRKLLESAPQFESLRPQTPISGALLEKKSSFFGSKANKIGKAADEDASSEDLLAALIESSSSDDFLVLSSSLDSITDRDIIVAVMILIKSHECCTLSHDIQGVAMVLRRAKFIIINILAPKDQMELAAKLLTSIGRFSEMNYVFDLFRDRNQFETLLSKGVEKTPELRIALFNYVKKNPEFYALVTLNFSMFREIAESLEASALKRLGKLVQAKYSKKEKANTVSLVSSQSSGKLSDKQKPLYSKDSLDLCLVELVDASDCYSKAGCYKKSYTCECKAKLVALQLAILNEDSDVNGNKTIDVLEVRHTDLTDLIVSFTSFAEAVIVADAYQHYLAWRQALFKNVILENRTEYLRGYCKRFQQISSALANELVFLYKQHLSITESGHISLEDSVRMASSMKEVLAQVKDVEFRCKIYNQLSFCDAKEELLQNQATQAHLKDLKLA